VIQVATAVPESALVDLISRKRLPLRWLNVGGGNVSSCSGRISPSERTGIVTTTPVNRRNVENYFVSIEILGGRLICGAGVSPARSR
jgi:hypothetical protein